MNLYRIQTATHCTEIGRTPSHFVDWYDADNEEQAIDAWREDLRRYGLPAECTTGHMNQCDPHTLTPTTEAKEIKP